MFPDARSAKVAAQKNKKSKVVERKKYEDAV